MASIALDECVLLIDSLVKYAAAQWNGLPHLLRDTRRVHSGRATLNDHRVYVIGIDLGKNWFHLVANDERGTNYSARSSTEANWQNFRSRHPDA